MRWDVGQLEDGTDSVATQVAPSTHWPTLRSLVCVVRAAPKDVPSTSGMATSVKTSALLAHRAKEVVPQVLRDMETALLNGDWESFAVGCMRDSNSFHATCLDTMPPITYMYAHGLCPVLCARVDCGVIGCAGMMSAIV